MSVLFLILAGLHLLNFLRLFNFFLLLLFLALIHGSLGGDRAWNWLLEGWNICLVELFIFFGRFRRKVRMLFENVLEVHLHHALNRVRHLGDILHRHFFRHDLHQRILDVLIKLLQARPEVHLPLVLLLA